MDNVYINIKNAIIRLLKEHDPDADVFAEQIKKMDGENVKIDSYYFLDIIPAGSDTVDEHFSDISVLVDIAYYDKRETNAVYLEKAYHLDLLLRPVIQVETRKLTIQRTSSRVVDKVLHVTFPLSFRNIRDDIPESGEYMEELGALNLKGV